MALKTCDPCTARYPDDVAACPNCGSTATQAAGGVAVPSVTVACLTDYCPARGVERRIMLRTTAPGVLERPTFVCACCLVPLPELTEDHMPKITTHGGPTVDTPTSAEGGEESSPGSSSSTSSEKDSSSPKTNAPAAPLPVRKTASRSKKGRTGSSSADSTDGDQTEPSSESDDEAPQ